MQICVLFVGRDFVPGAGGIVIEADTGLDAEPLAADHLAKERAGGILVVACVSIDNIHDCQADVQSDEVTELKRSHGMIAAQLHSCVDTGDIGNAGVLDVDCLVDHRDQDPVDDKAGSLVDLYRNLAELLGDLIDLCDILIGSIDAGNNFDQR